jgi:hypothetical protein
LGKVRSLTYFTLQTNMVGTYRLLSSLFGRDGTFTKFFLLPDNLDFCAISVMSTKFRQLMRRVTIHFLCGKHIKP